MQNPLFSPGDISLAHILTDDDHLYPKHINEVREAIGNFGIYNIKDYGALGNGLISEAAINDAAIQAIIDDIPTGEQSIILVPPGRYYTTSAFTLPKFTIMIGSLYGQAGATADFDANPPTYGSMLPSNASLFLITNTVNPFLTVNSGGTIKGLSFLYPLQNWKTSASPIVYPATIQDNGSQAVDVTLSHLMFYNSYIAISLKHSDRHNIEYIFGDPLLIGIEIDYCHDESRIHHIHFHETYANGTNALATWKMQNGRGIVLYRSDEQYLQDIFIYRRNQGIVFTKSSDGVSYGVGSNIRLEGCDVSLNFLATNATAGWDLDKLHLVIPPTSAIVAYGAGIFTQGTDYVKLNANLLRFWTDGAGTKYPIFHTNTNADSIVQINQGTFSSGFTTPSITGQAGINNSLKINNCFFESAATALLAIANGLLSLEFINNHIGTNTIAGIGTATHQLVNNNLSW